MPPSRREQRYRQNHNPAGIACRNRYHYSPHGQAVSLKWRNSPRGRASRAWSNLCRRAENSSGKYPTYRDVKVLMTREEFMAWAIPEYEKAIAQYPDQVLSLDRINGGHYELGNLSVITRRENSRKVGHKPGWRPLPTSIGVRSAWVLKL